MGRRIPRGGDPATEMPSAPIQSAEKVLSRFSVGPDTPMHDVLAIIDRNGEGVALVLDAERRLLGIVTDGDIRRAILAGTDFSETAGEFLSHKQPVGGRKPLTAPLDTPDADLLRLMEVRLVRHLPLVDNDGRVAGLMLLDELARDHELPLRAVVMAGGFGARLRPLTAETPKPLLTVGDKPVIEHIMGQLRGAGVRHVNVTTHFHAEKIREHLGDGHAFGVDVRYTHETEPLGTAGSLAAMRGGTEPLLVINGDILTAVDFRAMHGFHREHASDITVGVRRYEVPVPFGVFEVEGVAVRSIEEKPSISLFINAGIYLLEPKVLDLIAEGEHLDMTDLIERLLGKGGAVTSFPIHEYWIDIGQFQDYEKAQKDIAEGKLKG